MISTSIQILKEKMVIHLLANHSKVKGCLTPCRKVLSLIPQCSYTVHADRCFYPVSAYILCMGGPTLETNLTHGSLKGALILRPGLMLAMIHHPMMMGSTHLWHHTSGSNRGPEVSYAILHTWARHDFSFIVLLFLLNKVQEPCMFECVRCLVLLFNNYDKPSIPPPQRNWIH